MKLKHNRKRKGKQKNVKKKTAVKKNDKNVSVNKMSLGQDKINDK